jgi:predicted short-subunit dehydrogenase-like oxidoreductase (DUF2520 family)
MGDEGQAPAAATALGRFGFVGAGAAGSALARALAAEGLPIVAVTSRTSARAEALAAAIPGCAAVASPAEVAARTDTLLLAVPDDAIAPVAAGIPWRGGQIAVHLSGAQGIAPLAVAGEHGARVAALHPLLTFPPSVGELPLAGLKARLAGCAWALEAGDQQLAATLAELVRSLGGRPIVLGAEDRVPYHLAAVLASNYVVALLAAAVELWRGFGVAPEDALAALLPLTSAAVENLRTVGLPGALTGPVARGDAGTLAAHLTWLDAHASADPRLAATRDAYLALARLALPVAIEKGALSADAAERVRALLNAAASREQPT